MQVFFSFTIFVLTIPLQRCSGYSDLLLEDQLPFEHLSMMVQHSIAFPLLQQLQSLDVNSYDQQLSEPDMKRHRPHPHPRPHLHIDVSKECLDSSVLYAEGLLRFLDPRSNLTTIPKWPIRMLDATGKIPSGILLGNFRWMGNFEECLNIRSNNDSGLNFEGQYCVTTFLPAKLHLNYSEMETITWNDRIKWKTPIQWQKLRLLLAGLTNLGICWPSTCNSTEIATLWDIVAEIFHIKLHMLEKTCQTDMPKKIDMITAAVIALSAIFGILVIVSTVSDVFWLPRKATPMLSEISGQQHEYCCLHELITSFSILKHLGRICEPIEASEKAVCCIHGIKFIAIIWILLGHFFSIAILVPLENFIDLKYVVFNVLFEAVLNSSFSVDTFFLISGFLLTCRFIADMKKTNGRFNIFYFYIYQYWRFTPVLGLVILFLAGPFYLMGHGPEWPFLQPLRDTCRQYWWRNLLYINSLYDTEHMCYGVTWYLSAEVIFYIMSPIILFPLFKWPKFGCAIWLAFFLTTTLTPALLIHYHDISEGFPAVQGMEILSSIPLRTKQLTEIYTKPWCRMGPYLVGISLAFLIFQKERSFKWKIMYLLTGWVLAIGIGLAIVFGTYNYSIGELEMDNTLSSIYGSLARPAFAMAVAWVIFVCVTHQAEMLNNFLSMRGFIPFSRLTYCVYLIHPIIFTFFLATRQYAFYLDLFVMVVLYLGLSTLSFAAALLISITFEAPLLELEHIIVTYAQMRSQKTKVSNDTNGLDRS